MSYEQISRLVLDEPLAQRVQACVWEQASIFIDDGRGDIAAFANQTLRSPISIKSMWMPVIANSPGFAEKVDDTTQITDGDLLASVQANWPRLAKLYYNDDGTPR